MFITLCSPPDGSGCARRSGSSTRATRTGCTCASAAACSRSPTSRRTSSTAPRARTPPASCRRVPSPLEGPPRAGALVRRWGMGAAARAPSLFRCQTAHDDAQDFLSSPCSSLTLLQARQGMPSTEWLLRRCTCRTRASCCSRSSWPWLLRPACSSERAPGAPQALYAAPLSSAAAWITTLPQQGLAGDLYKRRLTESLLDCLLLSAANTSCSALTDQQDLHACATAYPEMFLLLYA